MASLSSFRPVKQEGQHAMHTNTTQLVTRSTRHTVNSSHSPLVTTINYADSQLVTRATSHNSGGHLEVE